MQKFWISAFILSALVFSSATAQAQWDYGQDSTWNIIESRIDARKTRARIKARRGAKGKASSKISRKTSTKRSPTLRKISASTPKPKPALASYVDFHRDTYQNFHLDDSNGYVVNFVFTSTTGKVIRRSHRFTYYNSNTEFRDIPAGKYRVSAQALYSGRAYKVHLGSEDGSSDNPLGGNFAPTMNIEVKAGKDQWGTPKLLNFPDSLHVRVIE